MHQYEGVIKSLKLGPDWELDDFPFYKEVEKGDNKNDDNKRNRIRR